MNRFCLLIVAICFLLGCENAADRSREIHVAAIKRVLGEQVSVRNNYNPDTYTASTFRGLADDMESIDLDGCPTDFVYAFRDYCAKLDDWAVAAEIGERKMKEFESGSKMFEAFARGMFGDPGGVTNDMRNTKDELERDFVRKSDAVRDALRRLQLVSSEYGFKGAISKPN